MAPREYAEFFLGSAGTGGAFAGLLFVAISIGRADFGERGPRQHLAEATLLTVVDGFVISSVALIPGVNVGWFALVMGGIGVFVAGRLVRIFTRIHHHEPAGPRSWTHLLRVDIQSIIAAVMFAIQAFVGLLLILHPSDRSAYGWLAVMIILLYTFALFRAWTLLGNPRHGLSGWLNPLNELHRHARAGATSEPGSLAANERESARPR